MGQFQSVQLKKISFQRKYIFERRKPRRNEICRKLLQRKRFSSWSNTKQPIHLAEYRSSTLIANTLSMLNSLSVS